MHLRWSKKEDEATTKLPIRTTNTRKKNADIYLVSKCFIRALRHGIVCSVSVRVPKISDEHWLCIIDAFQAKISEQINSVTFPSTTFIFTTMTDLTVLVSPMPLYPAMKQGFIFGRRESRPVSRPIMVTLESEIDPEESAGADESQSPDQPHPQSPSTPKRGRSPRFDSSFLSPPINTWKSKPPRPRHRPTRSQSAPPERTGFKELKTDGVEGSDVATDPTGSVFPPPLSKPTRSFTALPTTHGGELLRPPPPLCEFLYQR